MIKIIILLFLWNSIIILNKKRKKIINKKIELFNLGSSHSFYAFEDKYTRSTNLAENSQTLYYDYKILKKYFNYIEEKATCFITISYFSFASKERWLERDVEKYYKILNLSDFKKKDKLKCFLYKYIPLVWSIVKKLRKKEENKVVENMRYVGHMKKLKENRNLDYNLNILENIIQLCQKKSMNIIFITTPFTEKYNSFFSIKLLEENFYKNIKFLARKYNLLYLDFSHRYDIFYKDEYFKDNDHLSKIGSKIFIEALQKELISNNINLDLKKM